MTDLTRPINQPGAPDQNTGHGHVFKRPDGSRARCGGPRLCRLCRDDLARKGGPPPAIVPIETYNGTCDWGGCDGRTTALRWDADQWLSVCATHVTT